MSVSDIAPHELRSALAEFWDDLPNPLTVCPVKRVRRIWAASAVAYCRCPGQGDSGGVSMPVKLEIRRVTHREHPTFEAFVGRCQYCGAVFVAEAF